MKRRPLESFKKEILAAHSSITVSRILYQGVPYYKRLNITLPAGAFVFNLIIITVSLNDKSLHTLLGMSLAGSMILSVLIMNWGLRKRINMINPTKLTPFRLWNDENYEALQLHVFLKELISKEVLRNRKRDLKILENYIPFLQDEANHWYSKNDVLWVGGTILFILPFWEFMAKDIYEKEKAGMIIVCVLAIIFSGIYINMMQLRLNEFLNSKSNKYKSVARLLDQLRINLKQKYNSW